ncbi:protein RoBo-1-like isoform X2 [Apodemus sylvaticus]|nr:protein RoBo-1-like isoform X2 [Apodemus sylvaticus]XP_052050814.1 protein RoBo-1-like isoform X2 [Apodemus sylvaticus]XP_052050815.1 protein RoBo-1-like isoform X2 [Apodemus sylvaticus]
MGDTMSWFLALKSLHAVCIISHLSVSSAESYVCTQKPCLNGRCDPNPKTCESSKGCFSERQEFEDSRENNTWEQKGCSEDSCTDLAFSATLGKCQVFRYDRRCCYTKHCNEELIKVPSLSTEPNGVECPACYSESGGSCRQVSLKCTGEETMCVNVTGRVLLPNQFLTEMHAMGCATRTACNLRNLTILNNIKINTFCVSASPPLRPILSVLMSLFLMKALL